MIFFTESIIRTSGLVRSLHCRGAHAQEEQTDPRFYLCNVSFVLSVIVPRRSVFHSSSSCLQSYYIAACQPHMPCSYPSPNFFRSQVGPTRIETNMLHSGSGRQGMMISGNKHHETVMGSFVRVFLFPLQEFNFFLSERLAAVMPFHVMYCELVLQECTFSVSCDLPSSSCYDTFQSTWKRSPVMASIKMHPTCHLAPSMISSIGILPRHIGTHPGTYLRKWYK